MPNRYVTGVAYSPVARDGAVLNMGQLKRLLGAWIRSMIPRERRSRKNSPVMDAAYRDFQYGLNIEQIAEIHIAGYP